MKRVFTRSGVALVAVLVGVLVASAVPAAAADRAAAGAVYTLSNATAGNAVLVFDRATDGTLTPAGSVATGGAGTGAGLGSQGALVRGGQWLFAVNAGSNEISVLRTTSGEVQLVSKVGSGGVGPISLTVSRDLLYVLNAGDDSRAGNIVGFRLDRHGTLSAIPDSTRPLSGASVGPAQIQFSPNGRVLVVTEKATNLIDTYVVGHDGLPTGPNVQASAGTTPFGFDFDRGGRLIVSDAFGGAAGASALSSYSLTNSGVLQAITPLAPDFQTAACWVVTTGRFAYTTNTGSASVSSYAIGSDGSIALLESVAGTTGGSPIDAAVAGNGHYLYTLDATGNTISAFVIGGDGSLTPVAGASGLPPGSVGLAAR